MLTDEQLIQKLHAALERESADIVPPSGLLASVHEDLRGSRAAKRNGWRARPRVARVRLAHLAPAAAILVVVAVVAVFLGIQTRQPVKTAGRGSGVQLVYRAEPTPQVPVVNRAAVGRAAAFMRHRIAELLPGGEGAVTVTSAGTKIFVHVRGRARISEQQLQRVEQLAGTSARLEFYDWEADALTPGDKTVASMLGSQNATALKISQGGANSSPGSPGAGSMGLYQAVLLASNRPSQASRDNARLGPEYFAFGAPGSAACTSAASYYHVTQVAGASCYLAGPEDNRSDLDSALPTGVSPSQAQVHVVHSGTAVLEAVPASYTRVAPWSDPTAQFYVLRDHVALFGNDITNARQSTDQSGSPEVTFGFTSPGANAFRNLTATIARRGDLVSSLGHQYNQHFAVALDTQLIAVPSIDYKSYPDGVPAADSGHIAGITASSARALAAELRLGGLPIRLKLLAETPQR